MAKYTTSDLHDQLRDFRHDTMKMLVEIRDEVLHSRRAEAQDTREIKEKLMSLQGSVSTLAEVVTDLIADFGGTQAMIQGLRDQVDALVAQGTASAAELAALKAQVDTAVPAIDSVTDQLAALDASISDPTKPLDGSTPV